MPNIGFIRDEVSDKLDQYKLIRDCIEGEPAIKAGKERYLKKPQTSGDPQEIELRYKSYIFMASFFWVAGRTLEGLIGQVFSREPSIELPKELEFLVDNVDGSGNSLIQQSKRSLGDTVSLGRAGLLADFPKLEPGQATTKADLETGRIRPRIVYYGAERIINWEEENIGGEMVLTMLMLKEEIETRPDRYEIEKEDRWREFRLIDGWVYVTIWKENPEKSKEEPYLVVEGPFPLFDHRQAPVDKILFSFIGAKNNDSTVDDAPMMGICSINVKHFTNSADLEESNHIAGNATLVVSGLTQAWKDQNFKNGIHMGTRGALILPVGGKAELIQSEANSATLVLMKHKEDQMRALGAKLIVDAIVPETATGKAIEATSEASVLASSAGNVSEAYRKVILMAGSFIGEFDPEKILFEFNTDFTFSGMDAQERAQLIAEWHAEVITWEEARSALRRAGIATQEDVEAKQQIEVEAAARGEFKEDPQNLNA
ncbi:DUF4055 domain-containing protein [Gammaproteobacteria bacterium]|nr:DUF4055 domain-containing protein [Gammaproteobacteria bacterium]